MGSQVRSPNFHLFPDFQKKTVRQVIDSPTVSQEFHEKKGGGYIHTNNSVCLYKLNS